VGGYSDPRRISVLLTKTKMDRNVQEEYATKLTLIGIFIAFFTAFISNHRLWRSNRKTYTLNLFDLIQLALSTFRLGRLIAFDEVTKPLRQPFAVTVPDETGAGETVAARKESGVRKSIGQLLSCPICAGTWIAAGLVYGLYALPTPTRVFMAIMSSVGAAEIIHAITEALSWGAQAARKFSGNHHGDDM